MLGDGTVWCWGNNSLGQLGDGTRTNRTRPVRVLAVTGATAVVAFNRSTCALQSDGTVKCWGDNNGDKLGSTTAVCASEPPIYCSATALSVGAVSSAVALTVGTRHACALLGDGAVRCWGFDGYGELGNGPGTDGPASTIADAVAVSARWVNTCAILAGGRVQCWGDNSFGQLGVATILGSDVPVTVSVF